MLYANTLIAQRSLIIEELISKRRHEYSEPNLGVRSAKKRCLVLCCSVRPIHALLLVIRVCECDCDCANWCRRKAFSAHSQTPVKANGHPMDSTILANYLSIGLAYERNIGKRVTNISKDYSLRYSLYSIRSALSYILTNIRQLWHTMHDSEYFPSDILGIPGLRSRKPN